jgi:small subunit ribosomal protein S16
VAVKIKLMRLGKIREPYYRIVVADARTKRDGRSIEEIGKYHPKRSPSLIQVDSARVQYWLGVGAQPTEPVVAILKVTGDWQRFRGEEGAEGSLRVAAHARDKRAVFEAAAREAMGESAESGTAGRGRRPAQPAAASSGVAAGSTGAAGPASASAASASATSASATPAGATPGGASTPGEPEPTQASAPSATTGPDQTPAGGA